METLRLLIALVLLLAVASPSLSAENYYSWEDKNGIHYTNDKKAIPKGAKRVRVVETKDLTPVQDKDKQDPADNPLKNRYNVNIKGKARYTELDQCVAYKKAEYRLEGYASNVAYRYAVVDCSEELGIDSAAAYGETYEELNNALRYR
ncbi:DUF4124 domain-containing protein [Geomonas ferrireducens]|uniref:DUF4124 domain-containing protein n=1 Tax=Geomonas ferrireducens TaxID=2570227 RepID=UPI0010A85A32|nr:DUF4124 domain-containing protein [Geomonas ferrireducens]